MEIPNCYVSKNLYRNQLAALVNDNFFSIIGEGETKFKLVVTDCKIKQQQNKQCFHFMIPCDLYKKCQLVCKNFDTYKVEKIIQVLLRLTKSWKINIADISLVHDTMFFKVNFGSVTNNLLRHYALQMQLCKSLLNFQNRCFCVCCLDNSLSAVRTLLLVSLFCKDNCSIVYVKRRHLSDDINQLIIELQLSIKVESELPCDLGAIEKCLSCSEFYCKNEVYVTDDDYNGFIHFNAKCITQLVKDDDSFKEIIATKIPVNLSLLSFISNIEKLIPLQMWKSDLIMHIGSQKDRLYLKQLHLVLLIYLKEKSMDLYLTFKDNMFIKNVSICHEITELSDGSSSIFKTYVNSIAASFESKYGRSGEWLSLVSSLAPSVLKLDIFSISPFSTISTILSNGGSSSSKFILYNYSRIATLLKCHNDKVNSGYYPTLPPVTDIEFLLLQDETELLLVDHIWQFLDCSEQLCKRIDFDTKMFKPHLMITYLNQLSRLFSCFYNRNHILSENLPHLLPLMHARLYLVKIVHFVMMEIFKFFNITPLEQM